MKSKDVLAIEKGKNPDKMSQVIRANYIDVFTIVFEELSTGYKRYCEDLMVKVQIGRLIRILMLLIRQRRVVNVTI